nr:Coenzyme F420 hydrogenase/dehydrogenase, beta subunit C-terminal domain [Clostridium sp. UBA6640]
MKSVYLKKEDCCGCSACYNICAKHAITMKSDEEGFLYPEIDQSRCIDCGICIAICPFKHEGNYKHSIIPRFYATRHKSPDILRQSTSGGAFTAISDAILHMDGVVYGADYDQNFSVLHQRAETPEQRNQMRISKYVQSNMRDTYAKVKEDLKNGRVVLFTGTPCQVAGLRGFIGNSPLSEKLYLCDVICHSIPSPKIWKDYKSLLEQESGGRITGVQFRSKKYAWRRENSNKGFLYTTDRSSEVHEDDRFYHLFFKTGTITRLSCYQCRFTDIHRVSDLTIADYWGIEKYSSEWFDPLGVSLILVNSSKGEALLEHFKQDLIVEERPKEEALNEQKRLNEPSSLPENRSQFWKDYKDFGFKYILNQAYKNKY